MEYIGNYCDLIKDEWIDFLLAHDGQLLPDNRECLLPDFDEQNVAINDSWKSEYRYSWYKFEIADLPFTISWPVAVTEHIDWWVIKQLPGQCIPIHIDQNPPDSTTRYILMLQDYIPGHVLIWNGDLVNNYKKGDIYKMTDVNATHGSSNISNTPRLIVHLTVWNS